MTIAYSFRQSQFAESMTVLGLGAEFGVGMGLSPEGTSRTDLQSVEGGLVKTYSPNNGLALGKSMLVYWFRRKTKVRRIDIHIIPIIHVPTGETANDLSQT
jgi:hypothetical protein